MEIFNLKNMINGWFIGNFEPNCFKTELFEVGFHMYKKGCDTQTHYHKKSKEVNLVVSGKVVINEQEFKKGDIFIINAYEVSESNFLEDTELVIVKFPSQKNDKYIVK